MAKPIEIPNKLHFTVRLIENVLLVERDEVLEMRESKDTGNIFVRFKSGKKELYGLLIE